jgi:hypothetical protein
LHITCIKFEAKDVNIFLKSFLLCALGDHGASSLHSPTKGDLKNEEKNKALTWAGERECFFATVATVGSSSTLSDSEAIFSETYEPAPSGEYAVTEMPSFA